MNFSMIILNQNYVIWTLKTLLFILKTIDDHTEDEELQNDINKEVAKISASLSGKIVGIGVLLVKKYYHLIKNK